MRAALDAAHKLQSIIGLYCGFAPHPAWQFWRMILLNAQGAQNEKGPADACCRTFVVGIDACD
jgi:hypothetical protein